MTDLPAGTVTLLFTDMEGSTRLLQQLGERYAGVLADCRRLMREIFVQFNGHEVDTQGDAFFVVFARATDAIAAAVEIQRVLATYAWPQDVSVRVRIGLHTGEPLLTADGYVGLDVHHAARIMSAGHGGQILLSPTTCQLVEQHLPAGTYLQDLGEHRLKDLQRPGHLYQLTLEDLPAAFPALKTLDTHPNNLPVQPTLFIGREKEVADVIQVLRRPDVRLVTLVGPGGVGKTRLGVQVAAELCDSFPDGVFVVALSPVSDPAQVIPAIAQTLAIGEGSDQPLLPMLHAALKGKNLLLLLDNFEQVAPAAIEVAGLLTACPQLKLLVTSREGLRLRAEHEYVVPPLSVPPLKSTPNLSALSQYEAVALFIERAQAVKPDFAVTNSNAPSVAAICTRLDGLPLAIELAAARVKHFPPQILLSRLEQGLSVLSGGARDLPGRQQTLRGAIAWSYNLLSPQEQHLFRRLAVFVDGWTWEAAEDVCMVTGGLAEDILEGLASLVDKSLARQEEGSEGEVRFWMLQTLREFGLEQLKGAGELERVREAHAQYYLRLAEKAEPYLRRNEQVKWLARLEQEHENLRAALSWLLEQAKRLEEKDKQQAEHALRMCTALSSFWFIHGYFREGQYFLEHALAIRHGVAPAIQAKALWYASELAFFVDDYQRVEVLTGESLALYRELADPGGIAQALDLLGNIAWATGDYDTARSRLEEAAASFQAAGDSWKRCRCLTQLARVLAVQGEYEQARDLLEQSMKVYRVLDDRERIGWVLYLSAQILFASKGDIEQACVLTAQSLAFLKEVGHKPAMAYALNLLGLLLLEQGEPDKALQMIEESLALFREIGDRGGTAEAQIALARVLRLQGDFVAAGRLYQESLALLQEIKDREFIPSCLEGLAAVKAGAGESGWAARLWGKAEALREAIGTPIPPVYRSDYQQAVAHTRARSGQETFDELWSQGRAMTLEQVITNQSV